MSEQPDSHLIQLSTHPALNRLPRGSTKAERNADKRRLNAATADGWLKREFALQQLAQHLDTGASIGAVYVNGHRSSEGAQSQFIALDFDDAPDRASIEAEARALGCAAIIGETATVGHYRVILPLDALVSDPPFTDYARRVQLCFRGATDRASSVIGQPWFGFRVGTTCIIEGAFLSVEALLAMPAPLEPVRAWRREPAAVDGADRDRRDEFHHTVVLPALDRAVTRGRGKVFGCINPQHEDKHPSARIGRARDGNLVYFCTCGTHSLTTVGKWLGLDYRTWLQETYPAEAKKHKPKNSVRRRLEKQAICDSRYAKTNPVQHVNDLPFVPDHVIHVPLLKSLPVGIPGVALQSGVGTYKTGLAVQEMAREPGKALYLTHTKELAGQFVARAEAGGVTVELYSEMLKSDLYRANRLSACINTLVLYVKQTGTMPPAPALLIVDEISQFVEGVLIGGTMEGDEPHIADQVFRDQLAKAGRVLVMDAHLSAAALDYIRSARPDIQTVVNTHQTPRGNLYLCEKRGRAISVAMTAAMADKRLACAIFSIKDGQAIADQLASVLGSAETVLFIHAGNRGEPRQAAFLQNPNAEALKYQAIVYSPVIGTGYSIDPPVDVLVALGNAQQSAEDMRQFIGRFRNVTDTYAWMPNTSNPRETDAQAITDRLIAAAERTAHPYVADGKLHRSVSPQALSYAHHHGTVRAGRNTSQNQLKTRFIRLCAGSYSIQSLEGDDPAITALIRARVAEIEAQRRELSLTVPRIDRETINRKQNGGVVTEADHAGHTAWLIEGMTGRFNETWRDRLWTEHRRKAAARIADLYDSVEALALSDMEEAAFDNPLHTRKHRIERRVITEAFLRPLVGAEGTLIEYSAAELEALYRPIIEHHADGLRLYFGWYAYRTKTAPGILKLILRRLGLTLEGKRHRVKGEKDLVQFYQLEAERYRVAVETARAVVAKREADRLAAYEQRIAPPVRKLQNSLTSHSVAESVQPGSVPLIGWAATPEAFNQQFTAALGVPVRRH